MWKRGTKERERQERWAEERMGSAMKGRDRGVVLDLTFKAVVPGTVGLLYTWFASTKQQPPIPWQTKALFTRRKYAHFIFLFIPLWPPSWGCSLPIVCVAINVGVWTHSPRLWNPNTGPPGTWRCLSSFAYATQLSDDWSAGWLSANGELAAGDCGWLVDAGGFTGLSEIATDSCC